ncbi:MAG: hypothetical protein ABEH47_00330, partial [Haloferacaceae archaeon]
MGSGGVVGAVVAVVLVVTTPALAGAVPASHAAVDRPTAAADDRPTIAVTVDVDRTPDRPGHVRVTYEVAVPDAVEEVEMRLRASYADERRAVETSDFERTRKGDRPRYTAFSAGGETRTLAVEYSVPAEPGTLDDDAPGYDTESWTYLPDVRRAFGWVYEGSPPRLEYRVEFDGGGFTTSHAVFVGEYEEYTREAHGQRFRLVVPANVDLASPPSAVLATLGAASGRLRIGERDDEVYVVALGLERDADERGLVGQAGDRVMWVSAREPATGLDNTWVHEYAHTRQAFVGSTAGELRWFTEGSAEYLEHAVPLARGNGSVGDARRHLDADATGRLADPGSWESGRLPYARGARAVAHLNALVVEATDGEKTVLAVVRELNARSAGTSRPLTGGDLRAAVRAATPVTPRSWYQSYVDGTDSIGVETQWAFVVSPDGDPDGDGVANAREYDAGTEPFTADTDDDGAADGAELDRGTDPTVAERDRTAGVELHRDSNASRGAGGGGGVGDRADRSAATPTDAASPTPTAAGSPAPSDGSGALPRWLPLVALPVALLLLRVRKR